MIHKVPGNFHISSHDQQQAIQLMRNAGKAMDFTHTLNEISFGDKGQQQVLSYRFGEAMSNELSGVSINHREIAGGANLYVAYYLDITEIEIEDQTGSKVKVPSKSEETEQFPVYTGYKYRSMRTVQQTGGMNAIWFMYDITPVEIHYNVFYRPWGDFLVHMCAIIGGIFAAVGLFETLLRTGFCLAAGPEPKKVDRK